MSVTLLALFKRPEGGDEASRPSGAATMPSTCRYREGARAARLEGLGSSREHYAGEDFMVVTEMFFDDRDALEAAMRSDEMRAAGPEPARDRRPGC